MTWSAYLYDTMTGLLAQKIDIPSFSWSMSVSDSSFTTTTGKDVGVDEVSGLQLPWSQIPGVDAAAKASALQPYKRGLVLFWRTGREDAGSLGTPVLAGALGVRSSTRQDVSLPFVSMLTVLGDRYLVHENGFGSGKNHTSPGVWRYENLSYRALACAVIQACTSDKPGGQLPIDLPYLGEGGTHSLPVESGDTDTSSSNTRKSKWRTNLADGYTETTVDGDKTTVTESHTREQTAVKKVTENYTYTNSKGVKTTRSRTRDKTITTGKTVIVKTTVTENQKEYAKVTVTTRTTTYSYDSDGNQTGSSTSTDGPHVTYTTRQSVAEYKDYNIANHSCAQILKNIASTDGGPDMQFRPYQSDSQHIRFRFEAGSDGDIYLRNKQELSLDSGPDGGTLEQVKIDRAAPVMRVYGTGSGTDTATLCAMSEDLSLTSRVTDPWPLRESVVTGTDVKLYEQLKGRTDAQLAASKYPLAQFTGVLDADDTDAAGNLLHPLGSFWPGETFHIAIEGYPDWPDGVYVMRLMQMSGDESGKVTLKFDPIVDVTA
ncbi:hypothetical protein [Bifidobacterium apri]|uniref:Uncharacterized protein n=1 Tax=Bifidobacterium apri TaxID=1769423 RepID=A0A6A2W076_9BIFI|nr:hypothetical protein [Bifidobacterium apri]KAB8292587.1 hypothetical protein DSM100238_1798 [Bifidobacterium apri]